MTLPLKTLRIIFFGTSSFAGYHLYTLLHGSNHHVIAVFTTEKFFKNKSNHKKTPILSVTKISEKHHLLLFQSYYLSTSKIAHIIKNLNADIIIVVSYGLILPQLILNIPKLGCFNVHPSLLPRWRGAAPIQRALEHGDTETGISIIKMDKNIDTGNIIYTITCKILSKDTSYTLSIKLAYIGSIALLIIINKIILKTYINIPQNKSCSTYAYKLNKKEARINWHHSAIQIERRIRAFNPWPVSYFQKNKKNIKVWKAEISDYQLKKDNNTQISFMSPGMIIKLDNKGIYISTGSGTIILTVLQIPGKKITPVINLLNSYKDWFPLYSILK